MCQALRELMSDVIDKEIAEGRKAGRTDAMLENICELMKNMSWTADKAMQALGLSEDDQSQYLLLLDR